ncbi:MAG TPA: DUF3160 domain-containing protein, partial [Polyangiaceae bacterium]|nr:DUF3160 domain-containing protein [Polyangiaceae bacterium]
IAAIAASNEYLGPVISQYFDRLRTTAATLGRMAEAQRSGAPHSAADLAFINDAVRIEQEPQGCTVAEVPDGWYAQLFFDSAASIELDPTIADVHTQPADAAGNIVGRVLHVGTGLPRLMTLTVDTCVGPRAYTGMAYAYHEQVTNDFQRLTDEQWSEQLTVQPPAEVPWMENLVAE